MVQFSALPSFSEWQENVGRESSNFSQVTVIAFAGEQLFPSWLPVWKNVPQQVQNTRSNSSYVKFKDGIVLKMLL